MNNKGFTLVELIATIVILALVMSIAALSVTTIIKNAKQKNYDLLIKNINDASEIYYQECRYAANSGTSCQLQNGKYYVTLENLVEYGYLKGNDADNNNSLVNPLNNNNINFCEISIMYQDGYLIIENNSASSDCPSEFDTMPVEFNPGDHAQIDGNIFDNPITIPSRPNLVR